MLIILSTLSQWKFSINILKSTTLKKSAVRMENNFHTKGQSLSSTLLMDEDPAIVRAGNSFISPAETSTQSTTMDIHKFFTQLTASTNPQTPQQPPIAISNAIECSQLEHVCTDKAQSTNNGSRLDEQIVNDFPFAEDEILVEEKQWTKQKRKKEQKNETKVKVPDEPKKQRVRPNFFIGFPIRSQQIHENIRKVQNDVLNKNKAFEKALINLPTLHITLFVMHLENEDEINKAQNSLDKCLLKLSSEDELDLTFKGLGHFSSGVLFATISEGEALESLKRIVSVIREVFVDNQIVIRDEDFKPHLTILKLSKVDFKTKKKCGKVNTALYEENKDLIFGHDKMSCLQLLSMDKSKDEDGYYHCMKAIIFKKTKDFLI